DRGDHAVIGASPHPRWSRRHFAQHAAFSAELLAQFVCGATVAITSALASRGIRQLRARTTTESAAAKMQIQDRAPALRALEHWPTSAEPARSPRYTDTLLERAPLACLRDRVMQSDGVTFTVYLYARERRCAARPPPCRKCTEPLAIALPQQRHRQ